MIGPIKSLWQNLYRSKIYVDATVDHIELAADYLMLGLNLGWHNPTEDSLAVSEVQIKLFPKGGQKEPIQFQPQGHFARIPGQKVIKKINGVSSFIVPAGGTHLEYIRFLTRTVLNLEERAYPVEIHVMVPEGTYIHQTHVQITNRMKYRTSEAWTPSALI
jgi:hypothetical protein